ncbi:hypothetical protein FHL15_002107 [Xylaria flabelliformis]|uniref:Uncharacterized protein n=1 Tax=Xylaria flabelliformis TaxID=2512241 RepID=A0A553I9C8_9PEZI|nr:hypothetical protein FHL15_002107 [Xylaria flabelliformis]
MQRCQPSKKPLFSIPFTKYIFQTLCVKSAAQQSTRSRTPSASSSANNTSQHPADFGVLSLMLASTRSKREVNGYRNMDEPGRQFWEAYLICSQAAEGWCCSCPRARKPANPVDPAAIFEREDLTQVEWETWRKLSWELLKNSPKTLTKGD